MRTTLLIALTLLAQRLLPAELLVPMVWVVDPALRRHEHRWPYLALTLGLALDLLLEEVVGPGGIAWSASALACNSLAGLVADRSARAWVAFGVFGTVVVTIVRQLALIPLGEAQPLSWTGMALSIVLTGTWCGSVGWMLMLNLPERWRSYRARRLR